MMKYNELIERDIRHQETKTDIALTYKTNNFIRSKK